MANQEDLVAWSDAYSLDLEEIDSQHRYLLDLINDVWKGIVRRAERDELMRVMDGLERYTVSHFAAEEVFMRAVEYPALEEHRKLHRQFVAFIADQKQQMAEGRPVSMEVLHYLKDWLVEHILKEDRAYADFHATKKAPKSMFQRLFGRLGRTNA